MLLGLLALNVTAPAGAAPLPRKFLAAEVVVETSLGTFKVQLYPDKAPATVANFLRYVDDRYYDNTLFHRVVPDFVLQGGGYDADFTEKKTREPIKNESANGLPNTRGTLAAARAANPDSATAQFFVNARDNPFLDRANSRDGAGYCVFGRVVAGMDVVDRILRVPTGPRGMHQDVPLENVLIKSIRRAW
jgi:cyclophilin family peptidyl-prolyl cis-trans isomerase